MGVYYLLVFSLPLIAHPVFGNMAAGMTVSKYLGAICMVYAVCTLPRRPAPQWLHTSQAKAFAAFMVVVTVSYLTLSRYTTDEDIFVTYASQVMFFVTTLILVNTAERLKNVLLVAVGSAAFASLYMLREWQKESVVYGAGYRPGYVTGDPNFFTASAVLFLPVAISLVMSGMPRLLRWFCIGCAALVLIAVMIAASRGGFIGLVAALGYQALQSRRRIRTLVAIGGVCALFIIVSPSSPLTRLLSPSQSDKESEDTRRLLWSAGLDMVSQRPLMGVGLGNFKSAVRGYSTEDFELHHMAHNTYIDMAAELGLPGVLAFTALLYLSIRSLREVRRASGRVGAVLFERSAAGLEAGLVGFAVVLFFVSAQFLKLFWLVLFLSMCLPALVAQLAGAPHVEPLADNALPPEVPSPPWSRVGDGQQAGSWAP